MLKVDLGHEAARVPRNHQTSRLLSTGTSIYENEPTINTLSNEETQTSITTKLTFSKRKLVQRKRRKNVITSTEEVAVESKDEEVLFLHYDDTTDAKVSPDWRSWNFFALTEMDLWDLMGHMIFGFLAFLFLTSLLATCSRGGCMIVTRGYGVSEKEGMKN